MACMTILGHKYSLKRFFKNLTVTFGPAIRSVVYHKGKNWPSPFHLKSVKTIISWHRHFDLKEATLVHVHLVSMEFTVEIKATLAAVELLLKCVAMERVWTRHRRLDQLLTRVFVMRVGRLLELDQCVIRISTNVQVLRCNCVNQS